MKRTLKSEKELPAWLKYRGAIARELSQHDWRDLKFREIVNHFQVDDETFDFGLIGKKPFPSFAQTVKATLERLSALDEILNFFQNIDQVLCVVNGGSMSYGRFYSVRDQPPSDIDFIVVLKDEPDAISGILNQFGQKKLFDRESLEMMAKKAAVFGSRSEFSGNTAIFSHKLKLLNFCFDLSCHFMSLALAKLYFMDKTVLDSPELILAREYRQTKTSHVIRNDFLGGEDLAGLAEEEIDNGFSSQVVVYAVLNDLFYAGQYQCLIFPCLEILLDKGIRARELADGFKERLLSRFFYEKGKYKENVGLYKIHLRHPVFNPLVVEPIWQENI